MQGGRINDPPPREQNHMAIKRSVGSWLTALLLLATAPAAFPATMTLTWIDTAGDASTVGDVIAATLTFDSSGAWTATWEATQKHPFTGNARFNLNLFDTALGNPVTATAPQVSLDAFHDFGATATTRFSYSGTTPYLADWHVGDQVSSGNTTNFLSGVVNLNSPFGRDNLISLATIASVAAVPEPGIYAMLFAGLCLLGMAARRNRTDIRRVIVWQGRDRQRSPSPGRNRISENA